MILQVSEISSDTPEAIRVILVQYESNYSIIIEGKTSTNIDEFSQLRPHYIFPTLELATTKFDSLVEELRTTYNE